MSKTKYRWWVVIVRSVILIVPFNLILICDFISEKTEVLLFWLAKKLPDAKRK